MENEEIEVEITETSQGVPIHTIKPSTKPPAEENVQSVSVGHIQDFDGKNKRELFSHKINFRLGERHLEMLSAIRSDIARRPFGGALTDAQILRHLIEYRYLEMIGKVSPMEFDRKGT